MTENKEKALNDDQVDDTRPAAVGEGVSDRNLAQGTPAATEKVAFSDLSYEDAVKRLEEIVAILERGDAPLEQSMTLFREGVALADRCAKTLAEMKEELTALVGEDGAEAPFKVEENA